MSLAPGMVLGFVLLAAGGNFGQAGSAEAGPAVDDVQDRCSHFPADTDLPSKWVFCVRALATPSISFIKEGRTMTCKAVAGYLADDWDWPGLIEVLPDGTPRYHPTLGGKLSWMAEGEASGSCSGKVTRNGVTYRPPGTPNPMAGDPDPPAVDDTFDVDTGVFQCTALLDVTLKVTVWALYEPGVIHARLDQPITLPDGTVLTHVDTPPLFGEIRVHDTHEDRKSDFCEGSA